MEHTPKINTKRLMPEPLEPCLVGLTARPQFSNLAELQ